MTGNKIHFALIGAGGMGKRWASVLSKCDSTSLDVIVDADLDRARDLAAQIPNCIATQEIQVILKNKEIGAVLIATPHKYLAPITQAALQSGKHVLCEKPGAITPGAVMKNILLAEKRSLKYMVGFNHRFHDAFIRARRFYKNGDIGKIIFIRARYGFGGRAGYNKEWRLNKTISGGGELIDQGVHMIDLVLSFIGEVEKVQGFISDSFWKSGADDNAFVLIRTKKKALASIHVSLTQWKPIHNFEIYGTKGYLSIEGLGLKYGGSEKLVFGKCTDGFTGNVKEKVFICNPKADDSLTLELGEFVSAIRQKRQTIPSGKDAYKTLKVVEKIYKNNKL